MFINFLYLLKKHNLNVFFSTWHLATLPTMSLYAYFLLFSHHCVFSILFLLECQRLKVHSLLSNDIFEGDIRDGWITENLLKRANPSCMLIRHTLILKWYYLYHIGCRPDGIQSVSSAALLFIMAPFYSLTFFFSLFLVLFSLPMTLHKLHAIQVALVMLIGLGMA